MARKHLHETTEPPKPPPAGAPPVEATPAGAPPAATPPALINYTVDLVFQTAIELEELRRLWDEHFAGLDFIPTEENTYRTQVVVQAIADSQARDQAWTLLKTFLAVDVVSDEIISRIPQAAAPDSKRPGEGDTA